MFLGLEEHELRGPVQRAADRRGPVLHLQRRPPGDDVQEPVRNKLSVTHNLSQGNRAQNMGVAPYLLSMIRALGLQGPDVCKSPSDR